MPDRGTKLDVIYTPPFGGGVLDGPGRWFKTEEGFIWTNDGENLNLLDFGDYQAITNFNLLKQMYKAKGATATEAFDSIADAQFRDGDDTDIVAGDLSDLDSTFNDEMEQQHAVLAGGYATPVTYSYGITLDDDGSVLELVQQGPNGTWIRQDRGWTLVDPDDEENAESTVFGRQWLDVSDAAVHIFDGSQDVDHLTRAYFEPAILK